MSVYPITSKIKPPRIAMQVCCDCDEEKPIEKFSLKRGGQNPERKRFCTSCEVLRRKARNLKLTKGQLANLLKLPCSVCNDPESRYIDLDPRSNRPNGVLCKACRDFFARMDMEPSNIKKAMNYALIRRDFPFWHKEMLKRKQIDLEPQTPLLDWIEDDASRD